MTPDKQTIEKAFRWMATAKIMAELYEEKKDICAKYVHATSRGHEAVQLAAAMQLLPQDIVFPYYRDDAMLLGMGFSPYELMCQLMAKQSDYFSGGRTYYSHPSSSRADMPKIPHQSSATGMQAIPATGAAHGIKYKEAIGIAENTFAERPIVLCSLGDGSVTEGEIAEAFQIAVLYDLPIIYLVQDNGWDISAFHTEVRKMNAAEYAKGFKGMRTKSIDGTDFIQAYNTLREVVEKVRTDRKPFLIHATVPLLNHHTSGVRKEWYRPEENMQEAIAADPFPKMEALMAEKGFTVTNLSDILDEINLLVATDFEKAKAAPNPEPASLTDHIFAPTPISEEKGIRAPAGASPVVMVDAALFAIDELLKKHPEALLYGQDVGGELGGVFREAALLAKKYSDKRVFNTPIMEAYIIGSTVGMCAAGCKPIVEVQFADYIFPGMNQLFTEVSRSCYLSNGKFPVQALIRVPIGAYGSGGPYHSSSVESFLMQIKGIKVVYPSNAADMKGLMKGAFYDPNPVVMLEHKGLYWSKVKGTEAAKQPAPDEEYIIPLGKAAITLQATESHVGNGDSLCIITYGMGVHWALNAAKYFDGKIEILDLRTLNPLDEAAILAQVKKHGKVIVLTEETKSHSFAQALAGRIGEMCFTDLDAAVRVIGAIDTPAIPLNEVLEKTMLPNTEKVKAVIEELLSY